MAPADRSAEGDLVVLDPTHAEPDGWMWLAVDAGGAEVLQFDAGGVERGWGEVDVDRVVALHLIPTRDGLTTYSLAVRPALGERAIFTRRRAIDINQADGRETGRFTIHVLGVRRPDGSGAYLFVWPDGSAALSTDVNRFP